MNIILRTSILLMTLSLVFAGVIEAKHGSEKARSRVLKESAKRASYQNKS